MVRLYVACVIIGRPTVAFKGDICHLLRFGLELANRRLAWFGHVTAQT